MEGTLTKGALKTLGGAGKLVKSHELVERIFGSARKLGFSKEGLSNFISIVKNQAGAISFGGDVS